MTSDKNEFTLQIHYHNNWHTGSDGGGVDHIMVVAVGGSRWHMNHGNQFVLEETNISTHTTVLSRVLRNYCK